MRLIDADALIEAFKVKSGIWTETSKYLIKVIEKQPTAYDLEKVALELRHLAFRLPKDYCGLDDKDRAVMFDDAIDIVRKGGVE